VLWRHSSAVQFVRMDREQRLGWALRAYGVR
jgi:hypothetical protein